MSPAASLKDRKLLVVLLVTAAALALSAILVFMFHGAPPPSNDEQKKEVISKRAKIEAEQPAAPVMGQDGAAPATAPPSTQAQPAPAGNSDTQTPLSVASRKAEEPAAKARVNSAKPVEVKQTAAKSEPAQKEETKKAQERPAAQTTAKTASAKETKPVEKAVKASEKAKADEPVQKSRKKTKESESKSVAVSKPWAVNVASFLAKADAEGLISSLKSKGYNSYMTETTAGGKKWYRVRVGFFRTEDEGRRAARSIGERYNINSTWIVKPTRGELAGHSR